MTRQQIEQEQEQLTRIMNGLKCDRKEAENILKYDRLINNGGNPFPQTPEQEKVSKKMRGIGTREGTKPTVPRARKIDASKHSLMANIIEAVRPLDGVDAFNIVNEDREVRFKFGGDTYALVLSKKKK